MLGCGFGRGDGLLGHTGEWVRAGHGKDGSGLRTEAWRKGKRPMGKKADTPAKAACGQG